MTTDTITIVSGLPRSGTSLMMKMLEAGGLEPLTDDFREADEDNPKGYYEFERVKKLPGDTGWLEDARGKTVKILAELIKHLPDRYTYRIIFIQRDLDEVIESQRKMLIRRGEDPDKVSGEELKTLFTTYLRILKRWIVEQPNVSVIYVSYNEIMRNPRENIRKISAFLGGVMKEEEMVSVVDSRLYRNRMKN